MKLETFFEKFDQFADAPDAVDKMRELVLELAVQGKVADQDPKDEPAPKLLQRLVAFKLANPLSGRSGRSKEEPVAIEPNSEGLPANWVNTTIGEVLYVIRGASPRPKGDPQYFSETRTPYHWVKISDIRKHGQNGLLMDTDEFLTEAGMRKSVLLPKGTLVLTNSATIGVPIVLGIDGCCIHDGYLAFPNFPHDLLSQKFLLYLFHTLKKHAERNARGLAQLNLNTDLVRSFPFGLPPLAEQKRIVAKVDELMALCDRLEAQQQERETRHAALARASLARFADAPTPANLPFLFHPSYAIPPADLRKSILTLAVQGKLVPQDPNDEPASEMLTSDAKLPDGHVRRRKIMKRAPIASDAEMFPDLPASWEYAAVQTLYDLNLIVDYADGNHGSLYPRSSEFGDSGVTFVTARDIANGRVSWEGCARLNEDRAHQLTKGWARGGDVLLTHNATVGRVARVEREIGKFLLGTSATFYRLNEAFIDPSYFYHVLCSPTWQGQLEAIMEQTTRNQVSIQKQAYFQVPIPPLAEQRRIVAKVDQLMALVDALETQLAASRATAANLLSALVAELTTAS